MIDKDGMRAPDPCPMIKRVGMQIILVHRDGTEDPLSDEEWFRFRCTYRVTEEGLERKALYEGPLKPKG